MSETTSHTESTPVSVSQSGSQESIAIAAASIIVGLLILKWLPSIVSFSQILVIFFTLFMGLVAGLAISAALLLYLFYRFTNPAPSRTKPIPPTTVNTAPTMNTSPADDRRNVTVPSPTMPHSYTLGGQLSGILYTTTQSHWDHHRTILDWPPTSSSRAFKAWHAELGQGTLILKLLPRQHQHQTKKEKRKEHDKAGSSSSSATARQGGDGNIQREVTIQEEEDIQPQKVGIPLEGCEIELVRDCLEGRSEMVRRAPLFLYNESWTLLDGERAIYIFAADPAAKQQWHYALSYWCRGGEQLRTIEKTYTQFCQVMERRSFLPFMQETLGPSSSGSGGDGPSPSSSGHPESSKDHKKGPFKRWRSKGKFSSTGNLREEGAGLEESDDEPKNAPISITVTPTATPGSSPTKDRLPPPSHPHPPPPPQPQPQASSPVKQQPLPPLMDIDSIMDARWMVSRKVPVPPAPPKRSKNGNMATASAPVSAVSSPVKVQNLQEGSGSGDNTSLRGVYPSSSKSTPVSPMRDNYAGAEQSRPTASTSAAAPPQQQGEQRRPRAVETNTPAATTTTSPRKPSPPSSSSSRRLPPHFPCPLLPVDFFLNAAATRISFDLVRNPDFAEHVRTRVQRQLSRMHTPDYVQSLEVVEVLPGVTAPTISNFAAVPMPGDAVWPQLIFDLKYSGSFTVTIECKVDIRDAPAWNALDQAIDRIEGKKNRSSSALGASIKEKLASALARQTSTSSKEEEELEELEEDESSEGEEERRLLQTTAGSSIDGDSNEEEIDESSESAPTSPNSGKKRRRHLFGKIRHHTAQQLRKLAENTATRISQLPIRVSLTFSSLEGTMCAWIPPPPGDRLFWSFLTPPQLSLKASPQIGGRLLKYAYHASRASAWIQARMELSFRKNLVFPCGGDVPLPLLLSLWNPRSADLLPGLEKEKDAVSLSSKHHRQHRKSQERDAAAASSSSVGVGSQSRGPQRLPVTVERLKPRIEVETVKMEVNGEAAPFVQVQLRRPAQE